MQSPGASPPPADFSFFAFIANLFYYYTVAVIVFLVLLIVFICFVVCVVPCQCLGFILSSPPKKQHRGSRAAQQQRSNEREEDDRTIQWSWRDDNGSYTPYPEEISRVLTQAYLRDPHSCTVIDTNGKRYKVDFNTMTQTNDATGFKRPITKNEELESTVSSSPAWEPQTLGRTVKVVPVHRGTPEWNRVERKFQETIKNLSIKHIVRIQNTWLWERYEQERIRMEEKNNGAVNEMELFHGTRGNNPREIYHSEEGFDARFSAQGMWGQANYFAVSASYSDNYAHTNSSGQKEIFLASVLTGDSYRCDSDRSLRMPPLKPSTGGVQPEQVRYDTVTGVTGGSQVYMTYDNLKAYPTYLITYS